jgi:peptidoglycan/LPS O-acetylase OafA/YrhL
MGAPVTGQAAPRRVDVIDGFRAYAILGVVTLHLLLIAGALQPGTTASLIAWGLLGNVIDAFFIVSGFVLFLAVVSRNGEVGSLRNFATGRAARLIPPYWITLAVMLALLAFAAAPSPRLGLVADGLPSAPNLLAHLTALQMPARFFDSNVSIGFGINGPLWMISVIACFYLVFPLIAGPYYRHPVAGLAIAAVITIGWRESAVHLPHMFGAFNLGDKPDWVVSLIAANQLPGWAFSFALGMTGAWGYGRLLAADYAPPKRAAVWAGAISLAVTLACAYFYGRDASAVSGAIGGSVARSAPLLGFAYTFSRGILMAAIAIGPIWVQAPFVNRRVRSLAELSYAIYLIHAVIAIYVGGNLLSLPTDGSLGAVALWFGVVLPASLLYAYLMVRLVERPIRAWARRATPPSRRLGAEPVPAASASTT